MEVKARSKCPHCNNEMVVTMDLQPLQLAPKVRSKIEPVSTAFIYRITSDQIKKFLSDKAKAICEDVKLEVVPRYCEKKQRRATDPHRSYASLRIAFSSDIIDTDTDNGWFGKIGESTDRTHVVNSMYENFIKRYNYQMKDINAWLKNYKNLEELEEMFGITETYLQELKEFSQPRTQKTNNGETWVFFSAAAENVIKDMLTIEETKKSSGRIQIQDVTQISKDTVEFLVYVYPEEVVLKDNPTVRRMLLGEEKSK